MSSREFYSRGLKPLNCGRCCACCVKDIILIHPELGDIAENYITVPIKDKLMLAHKPDGRCIYLDKDNQCGIYETRPGICREFDCRVTIRAMGYTRAKKFIKNTMMQKGVITTGLRKLREDKIK